MSVLSTSKSSLRLARTQRTLPAVTHAPLNLGAALLRRPRVSASVASDGFESGDPSAAFRTATLRLQELLDESTWDLGEEVKAEIGLFEPASRLALFVNLSSVAAMMSMTVAWICGEDPLGGCAFNQHSSTAFQLGMLYGAPLMACSLLARTPQLRNTFPVLEDFHTAQLQVLRPMLQGFSIPQLLAVTCISAVAVSLALLPMVQGMVLVAEQLLTSEVLTPLGLRPPLELRYYITTLMPVITSSYLAGWAVAGQLGIKPSQVRTIRQAMASSERFFTHVVAQRMAGNGLAATSAWLARRRGEQQAQQRSSGEQRAVASVFASSSSTVPSAALDGLSNDTSIDDAMRAMVRDEAVKVSDAFKTVCMLWLVTRRRATNLGFVLSALNIAYLTLVWHATHDLAAPVAAAGVAILAELLLVVEQEQGPYHSD